MDRYTVTGSLRSYEHEHPERTAYHASGWDYTCQVWPNRAAMLKTIDMQGRRAARYTDWRAIV